MPSFLGQNIKPLQIFLLINKFFKFATEASLCKQINEIQGNLSLMFNGAQMVKNLPAMWETQVQFLGREDPLEKGMATHSSILT